MAFDAYIFDLDGTLLDTLDDLVILTNAVLREWGMPEHTRDEINSFVGGGVRVLLKRATPPGTDDATIEEIMVRWKALYPEAGHATTRPFPGIADALEQLKGRGAKLGVLSNKYDAATRAVIEAHLPGLFDLVRGECAEIPRKPDPTGMCWMMNELGVSPDKVAYVGDSDIDMKTACNAGVYGVGVSWGYRSVDDLLAAGAARILDAPGDLV